MKYFVSLAVLLSLSLAAPAFSAEPDPSTVLAPSVAPPTTVTLTPAQLAALVASASASPAPATKASAITADGILGQSWSTLAGWLGGLALMIFGLFKGAGALRARQMLVAAAEGAWHIAERAGAIYDLDGATKGALALQSFIESMGGSVNAGQVASARMLWQGQSAKAGLASDAAVAPPASDLAAALAKVAATSALANPAKTATDLAAEAAK